MENVDVYNAGVWSI